VGWRWGSGTEVWRTVLYLCEFVNPAVVVWCVLTGVGVGRGELETPGAGFVGPSVELFERLEIEGLVVSCCRDCGFGGGAPGVEPGFLLGALPERGVVPELTVVEKATWGSVTFVLLLASPDPTLSVALATLRASLLETLISSPAWFLVNFFHSHSPFPLVLSHFALHPAPTPSIASRGSSSLLKVSQLAYIHFNNQ